jgi:hypothetical protein
LFIQKKHYLVSSSGQTVIAGKWISSMDFCITDVITGCSFQALKLLLIIQVAETIPNMTIIAQDIRENGELDAIQKYVPWIVDDEQNLTKSSSN